MEDRLPLPFQIACLILTALFVCAFNLSREPRSWRRLFQSTFTKSEKISVNKNKAIDAKLKTWGIRIAMIILVIDVAVFLYGVTAPSRKRLNEMSTDDWNRVNDMKRLESMSAPSL
jgi:flagellar biosynthesis protein FlhB